MLTSTLTLQVSVEQIADAIKQMSQTEMQRLFDLVPNLHSRSYLNGASAAPVRRTRTQEQIEASVEALRAEILADPNFRPIPRDTPFLGGVTLGEYLALPDSEQARIWDEAAEIDVYDLEEREVRPDAILSAR